MLHKQAGTLAGSKRRVVAIGSELPAQVLSHRNVDHAGNFLVVGCAGFDIGEHVLGSVGSEDIVTVGAIAKDMTLASVWCARFDEDDTKVVAAWRDMIQKASLE